MSAQLTELQDLKSELSLLQNSLQKLRDEAAIDGVIDADEQAEIDELEEIIRQTQAQRDELEAEFTQEEEYEEEGGGLSDLFGDALGDAWDTAKDWVDTSIDSAKKALDDAGLTSANPSESPVIAGGIKAKVGKGGKNSPDDVRIVQYLLVKAGKTVGTSGPNGDGVDGDCGSKTVKAIKSFQQEKFGWQDGRVEPGGQTWGALSGKSPFCPANPNAPNDAHEDEQIGAPPTVLTDDGGPAAGQDSLNDEWDADQGDDPYAQQTTGIRVTVSDLFDAKIKGAVVSYEPPSPFEVVTDAKGEARINPVEPDLTYALEACYTAPDGRTFLTETVRVTTYQGETVEAHLRFDATYEDMSKAIDEEQPSTTSGVPGVRYDSKGKKLPGFMTQEAELSEYRKHLEPFGFELEVSRSIEIEELDVPAVPSHWKLDYPDGSATELEFHDMVDHAAKVAREYGWRPTPKGLPESARKYIESHSFSSTERETKTFGEWLIWSGPEGTTTRWEAVKYAPTNREFYAAALAGESDNVIDQVYESYLNHNRDLKDLVECRKYSPTEFKEYMQKLNKKLYIIMIDGLGKMSGRPQGLAESLSALADYLYGKGKDGPDVIAPDPALPPNPDDPGSGKCGN